MRHAIGPAGWTLLAAMLPAMEAGFGETAPAPGADAAPPASVDYLAGLDALKDSRWSAAAAAFTKVLDADGDNADALVGRGVAQTLGEEFPKAIKDLQRAMRLRDQDREARVWLAAALRMSGNPEEGSRHFSVGGNAAADYADLIYNRMAMDYWSSKTRGSYQDRTTRQQVETTTTVKTDFPRAAALFVALHGAGQSAGPAQRARMKGAYDRGDFAEALKHLLPLRTAAPDDLDLLVYHAHCALGVGDLLTARALYTQALSIDSDRVEAYLGRAEAAARLADEPRAGKDLESAGRLDRKQAEAARARIEQAAGAARPGPTGRLWSDLETAARKGAAWSEQADLAKALLLSVQASRLRFDETFQDRLRELTDATRARPGDPDRLEELARFLYDGRDVRSLWTSPRAAPQPLRLRTPAQAGREMRHAEQCADQALQFDPKHVASLGTKGWILYTRGAARPSREIAERGLKLDPENPRLLKLQATLALDASAAMEAEAAGLRTPRTYTTREDQGGQVIETIHTIPPSAADLARAAALEGQAQEERRTAERGCETALAATRGTLAGFLLEGEFRQMQGRLRDAAAALEKAIALDARSVEAHDRLAAIYGGLGDGAAQLDHAVKSANLLTTSVAMLYEAAWNPVVRTAWKTARPLLDRAAGIDPTDPRGPMDRLVIEAAEGKTEEALVQGRIALALLEADASLHGASASPRSPRPPPADDRDRMMVLRLRMGSTARAAGQADDEVLALLRANTELEPGIAPDELSRPAPMAMLPDPESDPAEFPGAPTVAALLAASHVGLGNARLAQGRLDEAEKEFKIVRAYEATWPATRPGVETVFEASSRARLGLVKAAISRQDLEGAKKLLTYDGWPGNLPAEITEEAKKLEKEVSAAIQKRQSEEVKARMATSPQEARRRDLLQEKKMLEKQRQTYEEDLKRANATERERQVNRSIIDQLQQRMQQIDASLKRLDDEPPPHSENASPQGSRPRVPRSPPGGEK